MGRINGELVPLGNSPISASELRDMIDAKISPNLKETLVKRRELSATYSLPGLARYRMHLVYQRGSLGATFHMVPTEIPDFSELGTPDILPTLAEKQDGLIIIGSPKGGGKSSTLAALIKTILEKRACQVITLENPIKFLHRHQKGVIFQREVGYDTSSIEEALYTSLHQNPDVLAIGGIYDPSIYLPVISAASGKTLILLMETTGVIQAIERFIDAHPPNMQQHVRNLLAISLECIVCQTLFKKAKNDGHVAVYEVLLANSQIKLAIREGKLSSLVQLMAQGAIDGMRSQEQSLRALVRKKIIKEEEAFAKCLRLEEFKKIMLFK